MKKAVKRPCRGSKTVSLFFLAGILLVLAVCLGACSAASKSAPAEMSVGAMAPEASDASPVFKDIALAESASVTGGKPAISRKRIVTGTLELQVADLSLFTAAIGPETATLGGYVSSSQREPSWAQYVVRIPSARFDETLSRFSSRGKVLRSFSQIEDVTEQWFDLDSRVASKRILLERYLAYLRQAKNVEELMQIERQVNDVTAEIEQLEGSFRMLDNQVEYSTLTITVSLPGSPDNRGFDLGGALADFGDNIAEFFMRFFLFILYFLAIGIPVALFVAAVWLLLFGRIGLARRLFALVSGPHADKKPKV